MEEQIPPRTSEPPSPDGDPEAVDRGNRGTGIAASASSGASPATSDVTGKDGAGTAARTAPPAASDRASRAIFIGSVATLAVGAVFGAGVHFANEKYWPYKPIDNAFDVLGDAVEFGGFAPEHAVGKAPPNASRETWTAHRPERLQPGYRALMGYLAEEGDFGIRLFDESGTEVHRRVLNYDVQDPDGPTGGSEAPHAFHFLADGSVVVNTDKGDVMTRYDVCGEPVWSRPGAFHHSFAADPRGGLWTWRGETSAFDQYQFLARIDPETGETLEEIDLVADVIEASPENRAIFTLMPEQEIRHADGYRSVPDIFHPNDLEVLQPEMADAFPDFEAGDLLMSFRNVDLVAVLDPDTAEIKWWSHGPWIQQHDPDFGANGEITVFNNNGWRRDWHSSIVAIDPSTRAVRTVEVDPDYRFYTQYMGKHEYLDDGTLQVVVPFEGRALELGPDGEPLLEINNLFSPDHNAFVADYVLLAPDFFDTRPENFACATAESGNPS